MLKRRLLVIYDLDLEYGNGLFSHLIHKENFLFDIKLVTNYKSLEDIQEEISLLLLDEALAGLELGQKVKQVLYLSEHETDGTHVNRYQSVDKLIEHIQNVTNIVGEEKKSVSKTRVIGVYSPVGGCGKTTVSKEIASFVTKSGGQAYYFDFGLISLKEGSKNADFFYNLHEQIHISEEGWREYFVIEEEVHCMQGSLYHTELWNMEIKDINFLLQELRARTESALYIFDIGFINQTMLALLAECDIWVLPCLYGGESDERVRNMKELIKFQGREELLNKIVEISSLEQLKSLFQKQVL